MEEVLWTVRRETKETGNSINQTSPCPCFSKCCVLIGYFLVSGFLFGKMDFVTFANAEELEVGI